RREGQVRWGNTVKKAGEQDAFWERDAIRRCRIPSTGARVQSPYGREREPRRRSASQAARAIPEPDEADSRRIRLASARARARQSAWDAEGARGTDHHHRLAGARSGPTAERSPLDVGAGRRPRRPSARSAFL